MNAGAPGRCHFAVFALLCALGCSGGPTPLAVEGIVTLDGQPVDQAEVTFILDAANGPSFRGTTDASGEFQTKVLPGSYKVVVAKLEIGPNPMQSALPAVYQHPTSTPFNCSVPLGQPLQLQLTSQPPG